MQNRKKIAQEWFDKGEHVFYITNKVLLIFSHFATTGITFVFINYFEFYQVIL